MSLHNRSWIIALLAGLMSAQMSACVDQNSMTSGLSEITPRVDVNDGIAKGDFPGCLSGTAIDNQQIQINFEIPPGATKMTIYRDGVVAYSSTSPTITSFTDARLNEGQTYHYTCEAVIKTKPLVGQKELDVATISVNAPIFYGIDEAEIVDAHNVKISWVPNSTGAGVAAAYYLVYANLGSSVDFSKPYRLKLASSNFDTVITDLGPQLPYAFGVRACSATNKCDRNVAKKSLTLPADPMNLPKTAGISKADLVNGQAVLTAKWADSNGAVAKRHIFMKKGNGSFNLVKTVDVSVTSADYTNPPQSLKVPDPKVAAYFDENTTYTFAVLDLDPSRASENPAAYFDDSLPTASFTTGDLSAPTFAGLSTVEAGEPANTSIVVKWTAIDHQPAVPSGASYYLIYLTSSTAPTTMPTDPCLSTTPVAEVAASGTVGSTLSKTITGLTQRTAYRVCVKARDLAGNISDTTLSKPITTRDITPPAFDRIQSLGFREDAVQAGWNKSTSPDLKFYRVKISKNGGATVTLNPRSATVTANLESTTIPKTEFAVTDGDTVTVAVDACDNASSAKDWQDLPFNSIDNCTATSSDSYSVPDSTPPSGFQGIDLPATCSTSGGQGTMRVQWIEPPGWNDYRGFKVYSETGGVFTLLKVCECSGPNCPDKITSCVVDGLDHYKTYKFHVAAYDAATPTNETKLPITGNPGSSCRTSDTTPPTFNWGSSLNYQDPDGMVLSWAGSPAEDDQKDAGAQIHYEVWRKAETSFSGLSAGATTLPSDGVKLTLSPDTATSLIDPVAGLEQGKTYFYAVYAKDESGNVRLGGILSASVPDRTPPTVSAIQTDKSATNPALPWNLTWTMSDNYTPSEMLFVTVRLNKSYTPDGTFPTETDLNNKIISKTATQLPLQPATVGVNGYGIDNQTGEEEKEAYYYYLVTVEDTDHNRTSKEFLVFSDREGPTPPASELGWTIGGQKVTTDSVTASTSGSAIWVKGGTDVTKTGVAAQKVLVYASDTGLKCDGEPNEVPVNKDATTANIALSTDGVTYSYRIRSLDSVGNFKDSGCSPGLRRDSTPPRLTRVTSSLGDGVYKIDTVIPIQLVFSEPVDVTGGTPSLKLDLIDSDPVIDYVSGSGTDTLVFNYRTASGDRADNLDYVPLLSTPFSLNGASIKDKAGHTATISLAEPGTDGSLSYGYTRRVSAKGPGNPKIVINPANATDQIGATHTNMSTVLLKLSADGAPAQMMINNGTTCSGTWEDYSAFLMDHPLSPFVNETATISVKFRDAEDNESTCVSDTIIHDSDPPGVRINSPVADMSFNSASITVQGSCESGGSQVRLVNDQGTGVDLDCQADGTFSGSIALPGSDGAKFIYVSQQDLATNEGTDNRRFFKDTTAPNVAITSIANGFYINLANDSTTFSIGGTCNESGRTVGVIADLNPAHSVTGGNCDGTNWSATFDSTWLSEGSHTLYAVLSDAVGNERKSDGISVTRDVTAPTVTIGTPSPLYVNNLGTAAFTLAISGATGINLADTKVNLHPSAGVSCGTKTIGSPTATNPTVSLSSCTGDGTIKISVAADAVTDAAGNPNAATSQSSAVTVDNTAPTTLTITSPANNGYINRNTDSSALAVSGACAENGRTVTLKVDTTNGTSGTCNGTSWSGSINTTGLSESSHTITAEIADQAGNKKTASISVTRDVTNPTLTVTTPSSTTVLQSATIGGECESGQNVTITGPISGSSATGSCANSAYSISVVFTGSDGSKALVLSHSDAAGNGVTLNRTYTMDTAVSASKSTVIALPASLAVGGVTTIEVVTKNSAGMALSDKTVQLTGVSTGATPKRTDNTALPLAAVTNAAGMASFNLISATSGGTVFTATSSGVTITQKPHVLFLPVATLTDYRAPFASDGYGPGENSTPTNAWKNIVTATSTATGTLNNFAYNVGITPASGWAADGSRLLFDGSNDFVDFENSVNGSTSIAFETWFQPKNSVATGKVILGNRDGSARGMQLLQSSNAQKLQLKVGTFTCESLSQISNDVWFHVVGSYNSPTQRLSLFVNGIEECNIAAGTNSYSGGSAPLRAGADWSGVNAWNGAIADIRTYGSALGQAEVTTLQSALSSKFEASVPNAPTGLTAVKGNTLAILSWTDTSNNEAGFRIERSTDGTTYTEVAGAPANATSATVTGLTNLTPYYFRIRAHNVAGNSGYATLASPVTPVSGYSVTQIASNFEDISSSGAAISLSGDDVSANVGLPFSFTFYGTARSSVNVCSNLFLSFTDSATSYSPYQLPNTSGARSMIAAWWSDFDAVQGATRYQTFGTAPNRRFIVQFTGANHHAGGTPATLQVKLFETTNVIEIHYLSAGTEGSRNHSVGIQNEAKDTGLSYYFGAGALATPIAIRFVP